MHLINEKTVSHIVLHLPWGTDPIRPSFGFSDVSIHTDPVAITPVDGFGSKKDRSRPLFVVAGDDDFLQSFVVFHSFERSRDIFEADFLCYEWGGVDTALPE